jgi:hypothetical protein
MMTSGEPPAADGMMKRIGFSGQAAEAVSAHRHKIAAATAATAKEGAREAGAKVPDRRASGAADKPPDTRGSGGNAMAWDDAAARPRPRDAIEQAEDRTMRRDSGLCVYGTTVCRL